jgi:16S rRNA (adenine1518-N6/adenine1519-N6)-dimethyltransferase
VKPGAFRPPPQVDSAVIALEPNTRAATLGIPVEPFQKFLSECFQHKRKTLRNNLSGAYPREDLADLPLASKRAEQCSLEDLAALFRALTIGKE